MGGLYYYGFGIAKDYKEAMKWYHKAADQGNAAAQYYMGELYYNGFGVDKNYEEGMKWYLKAAEQGDASAPMEDRTSLS